MERIGIAQNLYKQYLIGKYCDLELEVESSKFLVHKCVLAAASWVLETLLQSSTPVENEENSTCVSKHTVRLDGVTSYAIGAILSYIYTGKLNPEVFVYNDKLEEILVAAKMYKLEELTEQLGAPDVTHLVTKTTTTDESDANFGADPPSEENQLDIFDSCERVVQETEIESTVEGRNLPENDQLSMTILNTEVAVNSDSDSGESKLPTKEVQDHVSQCFKFSKDHGILFCLLCCKVYSSPSDLLNHMSEHQRDIKRRSGARPERAAAIAANVAASLALDNSTDIEIGMDMESDPEIVERKRRKSIPKKTYLCADCGVSYTTRMYLIRHYSVRHPSSFFCNFCADHFPSSEALQEHSVLHEGEAPQVTQKTDYSKSKKGKKGKKMFPCTLCASVFGKKREMSLHLQVVHGISKPMHVCTLCGKEFKEKASLRAHTRVHTGEKPYMCSYCGNSFADQKTWKDHERRHRGEKPFLCTTCGKSFTYRQSFTRHMKFHEGKRPFQCSFCGKAFVLRQNLKEHEKRHTK